MSNSNRLTASTAQPENCVFFWKPRVNDDSEEQS